MRILFITATRIGDAVISTGLLDHLVEHYPGSKITIACGPLAASLFTTVPGLEQIHVLEKQSFGRHWFKLWSDVRRRRWDLIVDLRRSLISYLVPTERRAVLQRDDDRSHRVELLSTVFDLNPPRAPRLWITPDQDAAATKILPWDEPFVAVAPVAARPEKTWPLDRFAELTERLIASNGPLSEHKVVAIGAQEDLSVLESFACRLAVKDTHILAGCSDLLTVAAVLNRSKLTVANDSGMAHLAAATGSPVLTLFGPTQPELYAPWGPKVSLVRASDAGRGSAMAEISVDQVFAQVESFLK